MSNLLAGFRLVDEPASGPMVIDVTPNRKAVAQGSLPPGFNIVEEPTPEPPRRPETMPPDAPSRLRSGVMGLAQGATFNFADELAGGVGAGLDYITGNAPQGIGEAYTRNTQRARGQFEEAEQANPGTFLAGQIGGAIATIPFTPFKAGIAGGAATGAIFGALSGAGAGEGVAGTVKGAGTGAVVGSALGAALPAVIGGAKTLYGKARDAVAGGTGMVRGAINPEAEAARRVQGALSRDAAIGGNQIDEAGLAAAQAAGQPVRVIDMGGETTRALARSSANTSPEGRQVLSSFADDRFEAQAPRATEFIKRLVGTNADAGMTREGLQASARAANRPAYQRAYAEGSANVWDDTLAQMASAPAMQSEIRDAARRSANKAASEGFKPVNNPFVASADGSLSLKPGVTPSLQFWDVVKRGLDDQVDTLMRTGAKGEANDIKALRDGLRNHLDTLVPSYGAARKGAATAFDAEDALEAGQKFVMSNMNNNEARRAVAKMTAPERTLFAEGFTSDLVDKISKTGDRRNVITQIWGTPRSRERIDIALGKEKARELESFVNIENTMDLMRKAVEGNSTTVRQLAEIGLAGGGAAFAYNGDAETGIKALVVAGLSRGQRAIDGRVAQKVAEMLVSENPEIVQRAASMAAKNPTLLQAIKSAGDYVSKALTPVTNEAITQPLAVTVTRPMFQGSRAALGGEGEQNNQRQKQP